VSHFWGPLHPNITFFFVALVDFHPLRALVKDGNAPQKHLVASAAGVGANAFICAIRARPTTASGARIKRFSSVGPVAALRDKTRPSRIPRFEY
jgi:hypothetical protein